MEDIIVAAYLFDQRLDGRYVPKVSVQVPGNDRPVVLTDPEGRTYRDLNRALQMDFWLLAQWRRKHAPGLEVVFDAA
jgi:hypothetical protein